MRSPDLNSIGKKRAVPLSVTTLATPTAATSVNLFNGSRNRSAFGTRARGPSPSAVIHCLLSAYTAAAAITLWLLPSDRASASIAGFRSGIDKQQVDRNDFRTEARDRVDDAGKRGARDRIAAFLPRRLIVDRNDGDEIRRVSLSRE